MNNHELTGRLGLSVAITVATLAAAGILMLLQRLLAKRRLQRAYRDLCGILARLPGTICATVNPIDPAKRIFGLMALVHCPEELGSAGVSIRHCAVRFHAKQFADERGLEWVTEPPVPMDEDKRHYRILIGLRQRER